MYKRQLSQAGQRPVEIDAQELNYFEIQNNDLSLLVESRTGRFEVSSLKNISEEKGSEESLNIFGKTSIRYRIYIVPYGSFVPLHVYCGNIISFLF